MKKVSRLLSHGAVCVNSANLKAVLKHIHVYFKGQYFKKKQQKNIMHRGLCIVHSWPNFILLPFALPCLYVHIEHSCVLRKKDFLDLVRYNFHVLS